MDVYKKKRRLTSAPRTYDAHPSLQGLMGPWPLMRRKAVRRTSSRRCHTALLTIKVGLRFICHVRKIMKPLLVLNRKIAAIS